MVQKRQFGLNHPNSHYCAVIFCYTHEYAVFQLNSFDDKHWVKVGEPGNPVAAVEHGIRVIVSDRIRLQSAAMISVNSQLYQVFHMNDMELSFQQLRGQGSYVGEYSKHRQICQSMIRNCKLLWTM